MSLISKNTWTLLICLFTLSNFAQSQTTSCSDKVAFCEGQKYFSNGDVYDGELKYGIPDGKGLMKFHGGDEYLGDFKNGVIEGKGAILLANGDSYHGDWANGEADGEGTYKKNDGSSFKGSFSKGKRHGSGEVIWKTGDTLNGVWNNDKLEGKTIFEFANGDRLESNWSDGSMKVKSTYIKADGKKIQGSMNTIYMVATMESDFAETKEDIVANLQMAWMSSAMEFKANQNYDLAIDFLMAAQKYGPADSEQQSVIALQLKTIDTQKNNSGWAQLPKK
ncbi:MAG TPA: hypothetical protein ENJ53_08585 [Phaeodactylibacter sp.]|nr:hypothetical protein [Phaeodactylibacter sp.]